jgi:hypothetical protein
VKAQHRRVESQVITRRLSTSCASNHFASRIVDADHRLM